MPSWAIYGNERRGGIHLPPAAVNLLTQPSAFDHADWTKTAVNAINANVASHPEGGSVADETTEDTTTAFHEVSQSLTKAASAKTYSFSISVKEKVGDSRDRVYLQIDDGVANGRNAAFDIANGLADGSAVGGFGSTFTGGTKDITNETDGWYRIELNGVTTGTETTVRVVIGHDAGTTTDAIAGNYLGNGTSGWYLYNAVLTED
jgi:hypothetical protein